MDLMPQVLGSRGDWDLISVSNITIDLPYDSPTWCPSRGKPDRFLDWF